MPSFIPFAGPNIKLEVVFGLLSFKANSPTWARSMTWSYAKQIFEWLVQVQTELYGQKSNSSNTVNVQCSEIARVIIEALVRWYWFVRLVQIYQNRHFGPCLSFSELILRPYANSITSVDSVSSKAPKTSTSYQVLKPILSHVKINAHQITEKVTWQNCIYLCWSIR